MKLSDTDLKQLNKDWVLGLDLAKKDKLLVTLIDDLKEARERLGANSQNSSRPPRIDAPWQSVTGSEEQESQTSEGSEAQKEQGEAKEPKDKNNQSKAESAPSSDKRKAGHQKGAAGHGRALELAVSATHRHIPSHCAVCEQVLAEEDFCCQGGHYVVDISVSANEGLAGLNVTHEKHLYGEIVCKDCGHHNRSAAASCADDVLWKKVPMNERGLVGPMLASLIVCLAQRMRLSRGHTQEFLHDWLGIKLSTSTINRCIHEAGRAVEPLEAELVEEVRAAVLAHADETPWKEWGQLLWMWVVVTSTVCLYLIGDRSKELMTNLFGEHHAGWLMSDGYGVYRKFKNRLRCWAHVSRKARGLQEAFNAGAVHFGTETSRLLDKLMEAVYAARESPPQSSLSIVFAAELAAFRQLCERYCDSAHEKTRSLAREFLNDWEPFWIVLDHPYLPLTNNEAERALRHWVIARLISQGTRTEQGTRAFGLLASVIETCRKRKILPWPYLARIIAERRKGNPAPSFATAALTA